MKKFKVVVKGLEQFIAAQEALFAMGYCWVESGKEVQRYADPVEIYVSKIGYMTYSCHRGEASAEQELFLTASGILLTKAETLPLAEVAEVPLVARQTALSRGTDPSTSKAAGISFDPTQLELEVLNAIRSFGTEGATQDDVLTKLRRISHSSITPRFRPLLNKGLLVDTGLKRKGVSGRGQRVMMAAQ